MRAPPQNFLKVTEVWPKERAMSHTHFKSQFVHVLRWLSPMIFSRSTLSSRGGLGFLFCPRVSELSHRYVYSFVLNCRGVILHFIAFYNHPLPFWQIVGIITISKSFIPNERLLMSQLSVTHFTALVRWNPRSGGTLSITPSNFRLAPSNGIINSSTSLRVVATFLVGHFITTPHFMKI